MRQSQRPFARSNTSNNTLSLRSLAGASLWAALVVIAISSIATNLKQGYQFDSNILALMPTMERERAFELANRRLVESADDQLLLLVANDSRQRSLEQVKAVYQALDRSDLFEHLEGPGQTSELDDPLQVLFPWRYHLLNSEQRQLLSNKDSSLVDSAIGRLYSPLASVVAHNLAEDPLQLQFSWQLEALPSPPFTFRDGWLSRDTDGLSIRLIRATLSTSPYNIDYQEQVSVMLDSVRRKLAPDSQLVVSGLILHTAHGSKQARGEITTIGLGSLAGIVLLLTLCFASLRYLVLAILPLATGCCLALALSLQVFDQLHLITLAFGASLVGVAIDYPLHYFCAQRESQASESSYASLRRILPGLCLGLISSVAAYAAQAAPPFPGLRQMALFSATGLIGAWLTVTCCLPLLVPRQKPSRSGFYAPMIKQLKRLQPHWPSVDNTLGRMSVAGITLIAVILALQLQGADDLRLLQTSPQTLLQEDARALAWVGGLNPGQYYVVQAESPQKLLQTEEDFFPVLKKAQEQGMIRSFSAVAQLVPSIDRQRENFHLQQEYVYAEGGLLEQLVQRSGLTPIQQPALQYFGAAAGQPPMQPSDVLNSPLGQAYDRLWLGQRDGLYYSIIALTGIKDARAIRDLSLLADGEASIHFVDRVGQTTTVLSEYRHKLTLWLILAYLFVTAILMTRYGKRCWRVVATPALAVLITLAGLYLAGSPFTLFHGLALLLIMGIGLDASIFLTESHSPADTWLAISMSTTTTLLAFGLLAFSNTPVLHFFGLTVSIGICAVWLLTPCFASGSSSTRILKYEQQT